MKKLFKMFGIIALVAVIGFSMLACKDDDGSNDPIVGNTITSGAEVIYDSSIKNLAQAKEKTDFSFCEGNYSRDQLNDCFDGSLSVTVKNNKVTIILGTPKSAYLINPGYLFWLDTADLSNAKCFRADYFCTTDDILTSDRYALYCGKNADNWAFLVYADRDETLNGTDTYEANGVSWTERYNVSLKKGWNYVFASFNVNTDIEKNVKYTASTSLPNGYKWVVFEDHGQ